MIERKIIAEVQVAEDIFPWTTKLDENGKVQRFYDDTAEPLLGLRGEPFQFGYSKTLKAVLFMFFEGCDINKVMMFKLTWGGK